MRLGKNLKVWLIGLGLLVFTAGSVQAGGVIEEWVRRYNGPANLTDWASAIAVDSSGNIYVTGYSYSYTYPDYATIKYDTNGNELWVRRYNGPGDGLDWAYAIAVDNSGNTYVTGQSATIKYDSGGNEMWVRSGSVGEAIAVDGSGNIYVTGNSSGSGTSADYATIKYDSAGTELWVRRYNGPGNKGDYAHAIAVDGSGNIYVTGESYGSGTGWDYATIKYDPNGNEIWVCRYNGPINDNDWATAIALDGSGNIYVTGISWGSGTSIDYATIKYDTNGNQIWVARYDGPRNGEDCAHAIAVDGSGNIYVTGESFDSFAEFDIVFDYATIKYDSAGNEIWACRYNGPGNGSDEAHAIAVDGSGNIYVTGNSDGSGTYDDYATIKYDSAGNELWVRRYNGPANSGDGATAIAVDGSGNIYVTGNSDGSGTPYDYTTIKYAQCLSPIAGDINDDCKVNFIDLAIIAENWLECNWSSPEVCW